jgi:hypothetical protein
MSRIAGALLAMLIAASAAATAGENPLLGTWKLKSYVREVAATGERYNERGEHPNGYLSYSADGRMYAIITWDNRSQPADVVPTEAERIRLYSSMIAYAGTYTGTPRRWCITLTSPGIKTGPAPTRSASTSSTAIRSPSPPRRPRTSPTAARAGAFWCGRS